ncbi:hypothetical protein CEXT_135871 [Caerostris extrusa]|uniref:Laminin G domain-containing protein n=1 Tax=Caerostris extrusa TaxID=172846 RepID=A0AAV4N930_CAEEX|nr:hypothetical protein CEXT_135871 [Caerostris extrusa]
MQFTEGIKGMRLKKSRENYITITFRTTHDRGLLLWMNKGLNTGGDYIAIAVEKGYLTLSFNLGKEPVPLVLKSHHKVHDNKWHTVIVQRNKRLAHLLVDDNPLSQVHQNQEQLNSIQMEFCGLVVLQPCPRDFRSLLPWIPRLHFIHNHR